MPTAVYIRVSSPKGQKTDSQRAELEAWLRRQRLKVVSGLRTARPPRHARERPAAGIALARKRGVYTGRRPGTTKAAAAPARDLRNKD
jgi:DNA invertase Pin-like site-specific DNA recombinase